MHKHLMRQRMQTAYVIHAACMQLQDLGREDAYNYELQYTRFLEEQVVVKSGDVLVATCIYDSMDRTQPTPGGLGSKQEMCINFLLTYPATCRTLPTAPVLCCTTSRMQARRTAPLRLPSCCRLCGPQ